MKIPTICRYCGGKIIKSTTRALYPKGSEPIYLCVNCNAYVGGFQHGDIVLGISYGDRLLHGDFQVITQETDGSAFGYAMSHMLQIIIAGKEYG